VRPSAAGVTRARPFASNFQTVKRKFSKLKWTLAVIFALSLILALWAFWIEPSWVTVRHERIDVQQWHTEHANIKIAILSDLHVGAPHMNVERLRETVERTNAERPDLIVMLGDFVIDDVVGGSFVEPEIIANVLRDLRAPLGVVAVLGNHDWWNDGERVARALRGPNIIVLENDVARIEHNGRAFWLAGIADLWTRRPDIAGTIQKATSDDPIIILTHNPDIFPDVPPRVSLTLAGHTHGGQVNFPFIGRPVVPSRFGQRFAAGLIRENDRAMFVSTGVGTSIIPVRFRVPPEVVVLTFR
jgi:uncharacterized protein